MGEKGQTESAAEAISPPTNPFRSLIEEFSTAGTVYTYTEEQTGSGRNPKIRQILRWQDPDGEGEKGIRVNFGKKPTVDVSGKRTPLLNPEGWFSLFSIYMGASGELGIPRLNREQITELKEALKTETPLEVKVQVAKKYAKGYKK